MSQLALQPPLLPRPRSKSTVWDTRYRPLKFVDVLGQPGTVQLLQARLRNGTALDTNYIFGGGHGQGKTTLARIMARAILCSNVLKDKDNPEPCNECDNCRDILTETSTAFFERDAASNGTIDKIRAIVDDLPFAVMGAAKRVYLFDEAHRLSRDAQDVLLKPMEDGKMVAMLCTTEPDKIRGAIQSRCLGATYTVRKVTRDDILERMRKILKAENVEFEDDAVLTVIDHSGGHVRDVLNRLEMIAQLGMVSLSNVREYLNLGVVSLYYDVLLALGDTAQAIQLVELACDRAPPEDVSAGLAEAAMNSYRLANNMHADFVYVDREKAQKVWAKFGQDCVTKAEFFTRTRFASRIGLICDVAALSSGSTGFRIVVPPQGPAVVTAPVQAAPTPPAPTPDLAAAPALPTVSALPVAETQVTTPSVHPPVQQSPPSPPPKSNGVSHKGALGSADPQALTDDDLKAIPKGMPRRPQADVTPPVFAGKSDEDLDLLSPDAWRSEFERTWPGLR